MKQLLMMDDRAFASGELKHDDTKKEKHNDKTQLDGEWAYHIV